jgi:hypothetical protein
LDPGFWFWTILELTLDQSACLRWLKIGCRFSRKLNHIKLALNYTATANLSFPQQFIECGCATIIIICKYLPVYNFPSPHFKLLILTKLILFIFHVYIMLKVKTEKKTFLSVFKLSECRHLSVNEPEVTKP